MTLREFTQGWLLLTAQPWGSPYRKNTSSTGEPMPGDIQAEFYFHTFKATDGSAWLKACQQYATGDKWPSVDALKASIRSQPTTMLQLPDPVKAVLSMGEALKDRPDLQQTIRRVMGPERESV